MLPVPDASESRDDRAQQEHEALARFVQTRQDCDFACLFDLLYPRLYVYFRRRGQPHRESEELAQNVMIAVHRHAPDLRQTTTFHGWLFRIARNELLMARRHARALRRSGNVVDLWEGSAVDNPEDEFLRRGALQRLLGEVDEISREVLHLRFVEELSYQDVAEALGIPLGTVKWRLHQARLKLGQKLRDNGRRECEGKE